MGAKCHSRGLSERIHIIRDLKRGIFAYLNLCVSSFLAAPARLRATTAAMALFFDTFSIPHTQDSLQIIQYSGPPKPKQTSRRNSSKAPSSKDSPKSNTELGNKEDLVPTSDRVEVVDLTCLGGHPYNRRSNILFIPALCDD
jgi:hypothetical protein